jgi:acetyl-CoA carboxylase carboxyltransferase component
MYEQGKAISTAAAFEVDDVIDPAETRDHLLRVLTGR